SKDFARGPAELVRLQVLQDAHQQNRVERASVIWQVEHVASAKPGRDSLLPEAGVGLFDVCLQIDAVAFVVKLVGIQKGYSGSQAILQDPLASNALLDAHLDATAVKTSQVRLVIKVQWVPRLDRTIGPTRQHFQDSCHFRSPFYSPGRTARILSEPANSRKS